MLRAHWWYRSAGSDGAPGLCPHNRVSDSSDAATYESMKARMAFLYETSASLQGACDDGK